MIDRTDSNLRWVEFIGPSGVGKSTLYKKLLRSRNERHKWVPFSESLEDIARNYITHSRNEKLYSFQYILKKISPFHSSSHYELVSRELFSESIDVVAKKYDLLIELIMQYHYRDKSMISCRKLSMLSWYFMKRLSQFMVMDFFDETRVVVHDYGILHNNNGLINLGRILDDAKHSDISTQTLFPVGVVNCMNSSSVIHRQVKSREKDNKANFLQRNMTDGELSDFIDRSMDVHNQKINVLKIYGVPILDINTSNEDTKNESVTLSILCAQSVTSQKILAE